VRSEILESASRSSCESVIVRDCAVRGGDSESEERFIVKELVTR